MLFFNLYCYDVELNNSVVGSRDLSFYNTKTRVPIHPPHNQPPYNQGDGGEGEWLS